jgi:hypothetical protein
VGGHGAGPVEKSFAVNTLTRLRVAKLQVQRIIILQSVVGKRWTLQKRRIVQAVTILIVRNDLKKNEYWVLPLLYI